ncbi:MCP four helix bundle domain-containing protein, partial [Bacillus atrophaeus]
TTINYLTEHLSAQEKDFLIYKDKEKMDSLEKKMGTTLNEVNDKLELYEKTISSSKEREIYEKLTNEVKT